MQVQSGQLLQNKTTTIQTFYMHLIQLIVFIIAVIFHLVRVQYHRMLAKTILNLQMFMHFMRCVIKRFGYKKHSKCGQLTKNHICWHCNCIQYCGGINIFGNSIHKLLSTTMLSNLQVIMMGKCHSHL